MADAPGPVTSDVPGLVTGLVTGELEVATSSRGTARVSGVRGRAALADAVLRKLSGKSPASGTLAREDSGATGGKAVGDSVLNDRLELGLGCGG